MAVLVGVGIGFLVGVTIRDGEGVAEGVASGDGVGITSIFLASWALTMSL